MHIPSPTHIPSVAWEGELVEPAVSFGGGHPERPRVTIGAPERWPAADVLANDAPGGLPSAAWTPPLGGAAFWLLRLACTLREPEGAARITEATQSLYLRPRSGSAPAESTYAYSLYPERETVAGKVEWGVKLAPELKFEPGVTVKAGELGATFTQRRAFPAIQAYGVGTPSPYWVFQPHGARPLAGDQRTYAVIAAQPGSDGVRATVALRVTVETKWGIIRFGPPDSAREYLSFTLP